MQPTIKELKERYEKMRDDQILNLLEDEGMRTDAVKILEKIAKERGFEKNYKKQIKASILKKTQNKGPQGIRGWLLVLLISLCLGIIVNLGQILQNIVAAKKIHNDDILLGYIGIVTTSELLTLIYGLILIILFVSKSRKFPNFFVGLLVMQVLFSSIIHFLSSDILPIIKSINLNYIFSSVFQLMIWGLYITESKRVKNTFIN